MQVEIFTQDYNFFIEAVRVKDNFDYQCTYHENIQDAIENDESFLVIGAWKKFTRLDCVEHIGVPYIEIKRYFIQLDTEPIHQTIPSPGMLWRDTLSRNTGRNTLKLLHPLLRVWFHFAGHGGV
ncbi:hypothetical protein CDAR_313071 [Caerostris darwini]|uniref:Uncharacterized protein n=1 Tax=Caerostris darwini TaxID=1538125 RepID=A0AAV4RW75_9ARAC|nr:hypothetical protein CDAR_313071 [Caerostris darwini]